MRDDGRTFADRECCPRNQLRVVDTVVDKLNSNPAGLAETKRGTGGLKLNAKVIFVADLAMRVCGMPLTRFADNEMGAVEVAGGEVSDGTTTAFVG